MLVTVFAWRFIVYFNIPLPSADYSASTVSSVVYSFFVRKLQKRLKEEKMLDLKPKIEVHKDISKSFECRFCHKLFSQKWILNSHSNFKHQKEDHKCDFCDEIFSFSNSYDLHVQKKHKGLQIFYCDDCDKSFQYQKKFVKHSKTCKPAIIPKKCEVCGVVSDKDFEDFKIFAKHVKTCGVVVQTEKKCDICGEKFNNGNALQNHKLKCGVVEIKFKCNHDQCYLEFNQLGK